MEDKFKVAEPNKGEDYFPVVEAKTGSVYALALNKTSALALARALNCPAATCPRFQVRMSKVIDTWNGRQIADFEDVSNALGYARLLNRNYDDELIWDFVPTELLMS